MKYKAFQSIDFHVFMDELKVLEEENRFHNWYYGLTRINRPHNIDRIDGSSILTFDLRTSATQGNVTTQYFMEKFKQNLVETFMLYSVKILTPESVRNNANVTLHFQLEKVSMTGLSSASEDKFFMEGVGVLESSKTSVYAQFSPPGNSNLMTLTRNVSEEDLANLRMDVMPGFSLSWWYTGAPVTQVPVFRTHITTRLFVK